MLFHILRPDVFYGVDVGVCLNTASLAGSEEIMNDFMIQEIQAFVLCVCVRVYFCVCARACGSNTETLLPLSGSCSAGVLFIK